jgi:hypothetical protein
LEKQAMAISVTVATDATQARVIAAYIQEFGPATGGLTDAQWVEKCVKKCVAEIVAKYEAAVERAAAKAAIVAAETAYVDKLNAVTTELS